LLQLVVKLSSIFVVLAPTEWEGAGAGTSSFPSGNGAIDRIEKYLSTSKVLQVLFNLCPTKYLSIISDASP
jgi:hypothetical protein